MPIKASQHQTEWRLSTKQSIGVSIQYVAHFRRNQAACMKQRRRLIKSVNDFVADVQNYDNLGDTVSASD